MTEGTVARAKTPPIVLGMVLFVASEVMFFGGLFAAYLSLRGAAEGWPPGGTAEIERWIGGLLTVVLLASSATQHAAARAAAAGARTRSLRLTAATLALGVLFLAGQVTEQVRLPFTPETNIFTTAFITITGFHGLHVVAGVAMLALVLTRARVAPVGAGPIEAVTFYWHFVDGIWLLVFTTFYVLPG